MARMTIKKELKVYSFSKKQAIITINTKHKTQKSDQSPSYLLQMFFLILLLFALKTVLRP